MTAKGDAGPKLFRESPATQDSTRVECLGMTFESDEARREYFLERLKEKLPELRPTARLSRGRSEDILRLPERLVGDAGRVEEALRRLRRREDQGAGRGEGSDHDRIASGFERLGGRKGRRLADLRSPAPEEIRVE